MSDSQKRGIRRLEYAGWNLLAGLVFFIPFEWLENEKGPSDLTPYLFVYGLYGLVTGIIVEKRAKNIGFQFKESFHDGYDGVGPVVAVFFLWFLMGGWLLWGEATHQNFDSPVFGIFAVLFLILLCFAIPISLYLLFVPENYKNSSILRAERKRLEYELEKIKEQSEIERLKKEIADLKGETQ